MVYSRNITYSQASQHQQSTIDLGSLFSTASRYRTSLASNDQQTLEKNIEYHHPFYYAHHSIFITEQSSLEQICRPLFIFIQVSWKEAKDDGLEMVNSLNLFVTSRLSCCEHIILSITYAWFTKHLFVGYKNNDNLIFLCSFCTSQHIAFGRIVRRAVFKLYCQSFMFYFSYDKRQESLVVRRWEREKEKHQDKHLDLQNSINLSQIDNFIE